jgi:alpha-tubulin suppressor-like RCC1 family protein
VLVTALHAVDISVARFRACALLDVGTVQCWGDNTNGALGDGSTSTRYSPVSVSGLSNAVAIATGGFHTCASLATGSVRCWGSNDNGQLGNGTTTNSLTPIAVPGI